MLSSTLGGVEAEL